MCGARSVFVSLSMSAVARFWSVLWYMARSYCTTRLRYPCTDTPPSFHACVVNLDRQISGIPSLWSCPCLPRPFFPVPSYRTFISLEPLAPSFFERRRYGTQASWQWWCFARRASLWCCCQRSAPSCTLLPARRSIPCWPPRRFTLWPRRG